MCLYRGGMSAKRVGSWKTVVIRVAVLELVALPVAVLVPPDTQSPVILAGAGAAALGGAVGRWRGRWEFPLIRLASPPWWLSAIIMAALLAAQWPLRAAGANGFGWLFVALGVFLLTDDLAGRLWARRHVPTLTASDP